MSLPPGARITTRKLLHAQSDRVYQVWQGSKLVAERLTPIDEAYAAELIRTAGSMVHVVNRGQRYEGPTE